MFQTQTANHQRLVFASLVEIVYTNEIIEVALQMVFFLCPFFIKLEHLMHNFFGFITHDHTSMNHR